MMETLVQYTRLYVVIAASAVAIIGTLQIRRWRTFLWENQFAWLAIAAFNFAAWFGCLDQLIHHAPGGTRTYITALAVTWALYAVLHHPLRQLLRRREVRRLTARHKEKP